MTQTAEALSIFPYQQPSPEVRLLHVVPPIIEQNPVAIELMHREQEYVQPLQMITIDRVNCALVTYGTASWAVVRYTDIIDRVTTSLEKTGLDMSANFDSTITHWLNACFTELNNTLGVEGIKIAADRMDTDENGRAPWFKIIEEQQRQFDTIRNTIDTSLDTGTRLNVEVWSPGRPTWKGRPTDTTPNYVR